MAAAATRHRRRCIRISPSNCWRAARRGRASSPVSQTAAALAAEAGHGGGAGERQHGVPTADQGRRAQGSWETQRREPLGSRIARAARGRLPATGWLAALAAEAGDGGGAGEEATALADLRPRSPAYAQHAAACRRGGAGHTHNGSCKLQRCVVDVEQANVRRRMMTTRQIIDAGGPAMDLAVLSRDYYHFNCWLKRYAHEAGHVRSILLYAWYASPTHLRK